MTQWFSLPPSSAAVADPFYWVSRFEQMMLEGRVQPSPRRSLRAATIIATVVATVALGTVATADETDVAQEGHERAIATEGRSVLAEPPADVDASAATCRRIADKLASVSFEECMERGLQPSGGAAVSGTPILLKEYPPRPSQTPRGRILLVGGIHGDEYSSVTIVFKWLEILDRFHSGLFHWRIIPLINPDGLLRRRSRRVNANGVDLDRNFPCPDWLEATHGYWLRRTASNPRRYPGSGPLSEPESRWLEGEIRDFRPDAVVAVHAPPRVLDFDPPPAAPDRYGSVYLDQSRGTTYPGSLARNGVATDIPVVTIELTSAGIMPPAS